MEPRIQYAQTEDGVSIAYWALGEGPPLVIMPNAPFSHIQLEWRIPEYRAWYERFLQGRRLIRYDIRGSGLSDRDPVEYSLEAYVRDLKAVVDGVGLDRFALVAPLWLGPAAVTFAASEPERVSHLILWCSWARGSDYSASPAVQAVRLLRDQDWVIYTETVSHLSLGWEAGAPARQFAALMRECVSHDNAAAFWDTLDDVDVTELLPLVKVPTLVVHRRQVSFPDVETSRFIASRIPGARLALVEGNSLAPFLGDEDAVRQTMDEMLDFLGEGEDAATGTEPAPAPAGGIHTILFTDIEGSTALTQRLGDEAARELFREHERLTRDALKAHGGAEVKTMGDGFMASFPSAIRALECAVALQRAFEERNQGAGEARAPPRGAASGAPTPPEPIRIRIGLNAGEPIEEEQDLFGTAVILAARIAAQARGGEILVSEGVRQIVAGKRFLLSDRGETTLRGFEDPVHVYELSWRGGG